MMYLPQGYVWLGPGITALNQRSNSIKRYSVDGIWLLVQHRPETNQLRLLNPF
jgi:hypothetical protein